MTLSMSRPSNPVVGDDQPVGMAVVAPRRPCEYRPMQDGWVGDAGDLLKLGLLRQMIEHGGKAVSPLGVNWYFREPNKRPSQGRELDPDLHDALDLLQAAPLRSVAALERADLLRDAVYFREPLALTGLDNRQVRAAWHARAREALADCPAVFLDPDNGMQPDPAGAKSYTRSRLAHVLWDELRDHFLEDRKTVIVFQHASRMKDQEARVAKAAKEALALSGEPLSVRSGQRWLYVIPQEDVRPRFEALVHQFRHTWGLDG